MFYQLKDWHNSTLNAQTVFILLTASFSLLKLQKASTQTKVHMLCEAWQCHSMRVAIKGITDEAKYRQIFEEKSGQSANVVFLE